MLNSISQKFSAIVENLLGTENRNLYAQQLLAFFIILSWVPFISMNLIYFDYLWSGFSAIRTTKAEYAMFTWWFQGSILAAHVTAVLISKRWWHVVPLLTNFILFALALELDGFNSPLTGDGAAINAIAFDIPLYIILVFLSFLVIGVSGGLSSGLGATLLLLLGVESALTIFGVYVSPLNIVMNNYHISPFGFLFTLLLVFTVRLAIKIAQDNMNFRQTHDNVEIWPHFKEAVVYWAPMAAVFVFFTGLYWAIGNFIIAERIITYLDDYEYVEATQRDGRVVTARPPMDGKVPPASKAGAAPQKRIDRSKTIEAALKRRVDAKADALKKEIDGKVDQSAEYLEKNKNLVVPHVRSQMPTRFPGTYTRSCFFLDVICHIENGIKSRSTAAMFPPVRACCTNFKKNWTRLKRMLRAMEKMLKRQ